MTFPFSLVSFRILDLSIPLIITFDPSLNVPAMFRCCSSTIRTEWIFVFSSSFLQFELIWNVCNVHSARPLATNTYTVYRVETEKYVSNFEWRGSPTTRPTSCILLMSVCDVNRNFQSIKIVIFSVKLMSHTTNVFTVSYSWIPYGHMMWPDESLLFVPWSMWYKWIILNVSNHIHPLTSVQRIETTGIMISVD